MNSFSNSESVQIWIIKFSDFSIYLPHLITILSENEIRRSYEYKSEQNYYHFIISRAILRLLLAHYLEQDSKNITLIQTQYGKPKINSCNTINFNLTHSGEYCLLAFSRSSEIGIDLEYVNQSFKIEQAINHICTVEEIDSWNHFSSLEKNELFYKKWVCVEAFLKAHGVGWLADEDRIKQAKNSVPYFPEHGYNTKFFNQQPILLDIIQGYASALFVITPPFSIAFNNCKDLSRFLCEIL